MYYTTGTKVKDLPDENLLIGMSKGSAKDVIDCVNKYDVKGKEIKVCNIYSLPTKGVNLSKCSYLVVYETMPSEEVSEADEVFYVAVAENSMLGVASTLFFVLAIIAFVIIGVKIFLDKRSQEENSQPIPVFNEESELQHSTDSSELDDFMSGTSEASWNDTVSTTYTGDDLKRTIGITGDNLNSDTQAVFNEFEKDNSNFINVEVNTIVSIHNEVLYLSMFNPDINSYDIDYRVIDESKTELTAGTLRVGESISETYTNYNSPKPKSNGTIILEIKDTNGSVISL